MIGRFIFLLLIPSALCTNDVENECLKDVKGECLKDPDEECLEDPDCFVLDTEILGHIRNSSSPCTDIRSYMCTDYENYSRKNPLSYRLSEMQVYFHDLLGSPPKNDDSELLAVEKKLYRSCMKLDNLRSQKESHSADLWAQLSYLKSIEKWENVEKKLFSLGFGFSFFDIKVIPHPEQESRNTILLQPPSLLYLQNLNNKLRKIIEYIRQYRIVNPLLGGAQGVDSLYPFINVVSGRKIRDIFEKLQEAKSTQPDSKEKFPGYYTTVGQFKQMEIAGNDASSQVKWIAIIQYALHKVNTEFDADNIVLKNPQYFLELSKILQDNPNDIIAMAIQTRAVTDSLPYINWETANLVEIINKHEFCLKETKLYGASRLMVHDWLTILSEDDSRHMNFKKGEAIFESLMSVIQDEIALYNSHPSAKASYYSRKLFHVIDNLAKYVYEPPYNIYYDLDISSGSHWKNILEYRKLLYSNDLKLLQNTFDVSRPFSFLDQDEPQNRFIISAIINIVEMHLPNLPKAVHYGTFGVRTAGLIHSLLHEDTYNQDDDTKRSETMSLTYPSYPENVENCIKSKLAMDNFVGRVDDSITQVLALNTAYKALKHDSHIAFHSISNTILSAKNITQEKLFFLAYVQDNCFVERHVISRVLSHNQLFDKAFTCNNEAHEDEKSCMLGRLNY